GSVNSPVRGRVGWWGRGRNRAGRGGGEERTRPRIGPRRADSCHRSGADGSGADGVPAGGDGGGIGLLDDAAAAGPVGKDEAEAAALVEELERRMQEAADNLEFELAADIRDRIRTLHQDFDLDGDDGIEPEAGADGLGLEPEAEDF
ncbi:MAG: UvrB/UvrC motif-containing protein, partial [Halanaeroarchaeum sp.]